MSKYSINKARQLVSGLRVPRRRFTYGAATPGQEQPLDRDSSMGRPDRRWLPGLRRRDRLRDPRLRSHGRDRGHIDRHAHGGEPTMNRCLTVIPVAKFTIEAPVREAQPATRQWGLAVTTNAVTANQEAGPSGGGSHEAIPLVVAVDADIRDGAGETLPLDRIAEGDVIEWVAESHGELWIARQLLVTSGPLAGGDAPAPPEGG
jgi:hypothetical protein